MKNNNLEGQILRIQNGNCTKNDKISNKEKMNFLKKSFNIFLLFFY